MGDDDPYSIPNTNVLKNKLGITDGSELLRAERLIATVRVADIPPLKYFSLHEYLSIHKILFQDIYEWAGQARHQMPVFTGVGSEGFKPLSEGLNDVDRSLKGLAFSMERLAQANIEQFAEIAASVFTVINKAHIFREGNGRTQRFFLFKLAEAVGLSMDIQGLSGPAWNIASLMASMGDKSYLIEQITFSLVPKTALSLLKSEAKQHLLDDYQHIEFMAQNQNSASFEYNADKLVAQLVGVMGALDKVKGRAKITIYRSITSSSSSPRLLASQLITLPLAIVEPASKEGNPFECALPPY